MSHVLTGRTTRASVAQEGIWITERLGGGPAYRMPLTVRFHGPLDVPAMLAACRSVIDRHPVLGAVVGEADGTIVLSQAVAEPPVTLADPIDPSRLDQFIRQDVERGFDLRQGPLSRFTLVPLGPDDHLLLFVAHHLVFDGMSKDILLRDLAAYYTARVDDTARQPAPLAPSFAVAAAQEQENVSATLPEARAFWQERWSPPAPIALPGQTAATPLTSAGEAVTFTFEEDLRQAVIALTREIGATTFEVLLSAMHVLLHRYGATQPAVAVDLSTRTTRTKNHIGPFVNELPVITRPDPRASFGAFVLDVRAHVREIYRFRQTPLARAVTGVTPRGAMTPVSLSYRRRDPAPRFPGLDIEVEWMMFNGGVRNVLHVQAVDAPDGLAMTLQFAPSAVDRSVVTRFATHLRALLRSAAADPGTALADLYIADDLPTLTDLPADDTAPAVPEQQTASAALDPALVKIVTDIWCEVLGLDTVAPTDDLFDLGGHSLTITQITARVRETTGAEIPLDVFFDTPTVTGVVEAVMRARGDDPAGTTQPAQNDLTPRPEGTPPPLSFAQERLWFLHQFDPGDAAYNMYIVRRLRGELDTAALTAALSGLVARHETLRMSFPNVDGEPRVVVHAPAPVTVEHLEAADEEEARRLVAERTNAPFDLGAGPPLRVALIRLADDEHVLCMVMHHIVGDGWSLNVLFDDLAELYRAEKCGTVADLPPLPVQYGDIALWQREHDAGGEESLEYWKRQLARPSPVELPTDRKGTRGRGGDFHQFRVPAPVAASLERIAKEQGATLFMVLVAAYQTLLSRHSGQTDVTVGTQWAVRDRVEMEPVVGPLTDTLILRGDLTGDPAFLDLLDRTRRTVLDAHAHRDVPFERLVGELDLPRDIERHPLLSTMVLLNGEETDVATRDRFGDLDAELFDAGFRRAMLDLTLEVWRTDDGLLLSFGYDTGVFSDAAIRRLATRFQRLLGGIAAAPDSRLSALPLLPDEERALLLVDWNNTRCTVPDATVTDLFIRRVAEHPRATAVIDGDDRLTYGELAERAAKIAHRLRAAGAGSGTLVALRLERGIDALAAMLGTMMSGAAYLPLDPEYPPARIAYVLADSGATLLLTDTTGVTAAAPPAEVTVLDLADPALLDGMPSDPPTPEPTPHDTAYVLYTSGSTGRPKGVVIPHAALTNFLSAMGDVIGSTPDDVWLGLTSLSFDISGLELYLPLVTGGRVVIADREAARDGAVLAGLIRRHGVTHVQATPSGWRVLLSGGIGGIDGLVGLVGGEALPLPLARELRPALRRLVNVYGPTETTIWSTAWEVPADPEEIRIGRPIGNTTCHVVDEAGQLVPIGVAGELVIGGLGVARGYLGRPALTAERFIPDPYGPPGSRLYRTGDRVRRLPDGDLEFLGRSDHQVKIRGFRIELGEIESCLLTHPSINQAAVMVTGGDDDPRLVAYVVGPDGEVDATELRAHLADTLPPYMVPNLFMTLDALPLTPNGKLDRAALPLPAAPVTGKGGAPTTPTERLVAQVFADVLGLPHVGADDDFFALGGHSLLVTKVVARFAAALGVTVPVRELFLHPTVSGLAAALDAMSADDADPGAPPVDADPVPRPEGTPLPLTFAQERLWFLHQLDPDDSTYNVFMVLRLRGALDIRALRAALSGLVARHESLRMSFPNVDGEPRVVVHPPAPVTVKHLEAADEEEARRLIVEHTNAPFDLGAGPPLRVALIRLADDHHVLCLAMHHIISDGWSINVLFDDLAELYRAERYGTAADLRPLRVQYGDIMLWQRRREAEIVEESLEYWKRQLAQPPLVDLAPDRSEERRERKGPALSASHSFQIPGEVLSAIETIAAERGATLFMALLTAFQTLVAQQAGQDEVLVGTVWATRDRVELEPLVGYLTNTLVLRGDLTGDPTFTDLLDRTWDTVLDALDHPHVPFERLNSELDLPRDTRHSPLLSTMFILHTQTGDGGSRNRLADLDVQFLDGELQHAKFDLLLESWHLGDDLLFTLTYDTTLFTPAEAAALADRFTLLLRAFTAAPDRPLSALPTLTAAEEATLRSLAAAPAPASSAPVARRTVPELFAASVAANPGAAAVFCGDEHVTYGELDARVGRLAARLRRTGVRPGAVVGVCLGRSIDAVAALLAVWRAGGAYLPLDPEYPDDRLTLLLEDAAATVVVTHADLADRFPSHITTLVVEDGEAEGDTLTGEPPHPRDAAYIIYTSGSTGLPKGVVVDHGALAERVAWMREAYGLTPEDRVVQFASLSFDTHAEEIHPALAAGAALVLLPDGAATLPDVLRTPAGRAVTVLDLPTAYWHGLTEAPDDIPWPPGLRLVIIGGEQAHAAAVARWRARFGDRVRLVNTYGPTEATIVATAADLGEADAGRRPSIGRPIAATTAYVLDSRGRLAPPGAPGELCLGGAALARGYLGRPSATAERFIPDPYGPPGSRLYRTGDRVRWRPDGTLVFLGRLDGQVKVRGFRVEPGEIEARLLAHPAAGQAAVAVRGDRLVAYWTGTAEPEDLRRHLAETLPPFMVPTGWVRLEEIPLTVTGKINVAALPDPPPLHAAEYVPPRTEAELLLAEIWSEVLGVENIGATDDFFDVGGHSLLVTQVIARLRAALDVDVPMRIMFDHTTVADMATALEELLVEELAESSGDEAGHETPGTP